MKTFGELSIKLNQLPAEEFGDLAAAAATNGWVRERSKDDEMKRTGQGVWFSFTLTGHKSLPPAYLFLTQKSPGVLHVPNIISPARDRLNFDDYNDILNSFRDDVLRHVHPQNAIDVSLTGTTVDLRLQLPQRVYEPLHLFSVAANRITGSSHPLDRERWMDFLITSVEEGVTLDAHTLSRWLIEEEQWEPDQASRLAEEYEFGRDLLERRRRAS